MEQITRKLETC